MFDVIGTDDREVSTVKCRDLELVQAFCQRHDRNVGAAQREIPVLLDQRGRPQQVGFGRPFDLIAMRAQRPQEGSLGSRTRACSMR